MNVDSIVNGWSSTKYENSRWDDSVPSTVPYIDKDNQSNSKIKNYNIGKEDFPANVQFKHDLSC